ncbi:pepcterm_polyde, polysaccharide deacetylase family protein, PEP-CTERM locus subfamily [Methylophilaceae bacterium]
MRILTFDIEDWFHILDHEETASTNSWHNYDSRLEFNALRILDFLDRKGIKATFFCLGWIAERYPEIVRRIVELGHELGSHSHIHQLVYNQRPKEFRDDLKMSLSILEDVSCQKITAYRAPGFSVTRETPWMFDELIEAGVTHDCSIFPISRAHGGFVGAPSKPFILERSGCELKAFPMSTYSLLGRPVVFSGGGYFRLLNYQIIKHMMNKSDYVMTYFHPRDFDPDQPMIPGLNRLRRFKSYVGLKGSLNKLDRLVDDFEFCSLRAADALINYNDLPRFKI